MARNADLNFKVEHIFLRVGKATVPIFNESTFGLPTLEATRKLPNTVPISKEDYDDGNFLQWTYWFLAPTHTPQGIMGAIQRPKYFPSIKDCLQHTELQWKHRDDYIEADAVHRIAEEKADDMDEGSDSSYSGGSTTSSSSSGSSRDPRKKRRRPPSPCERGDVLSMLPITLGPLGDSFALTHVLEVIPHKDWLKEEKEGMWG